MSTKLEPMLRIVFVFSVLMLMLKLVAYATAIWFGVHFQWVNTVALVLIGELFNLGSKQFNSVFGDLAKLSDAQKENEEVLAPDFVDSEFIETNSNN